MSEEALYLKAGAIVRLGGQWYELTTDLNANGRSLTMCDEKSEVKVSAEGAIAQTVICGLPKGHQDMPDQHTDLIPFWRTDVDRGDYSTKYHRGEAFLRWP